MTRSLRFYLLLVLLSSASLYTVDAREIQSRAVLSGHTSFVTSVVISPDSKLVASAAKDGNVILWDIATGKELATLRGHTDRITSLAFSPDGKLLVSAGFDRSVRLWDVAKRRSVFTLRGHTHWVNAVAFSPDGQILATGSSDKSIRLWDPSTGKSLATIPTGFFAVSALAFSPNGKTLAVGSHSANVEFWNVESRKKVSSFDAGASVLSLAYMPDGKSVVVAAGSLFSGEDPPVLKLWDVETGKEKLAFKGHKKLVWNLALSADGKTLATASFDLTAKLWDTSTGKELATLDGHTSGVLGVALAADGKTVATGSHDRTIRLWDMPRTDRAPSVVRATLRGHTTEVAGVAFSPDGRTLATGGAKNVRLWDVETGRERRVLRGHNDAVYSVAFSPDGKLLASTSFDRTVRVWDVATGKLVSVLEGHKYPVLGVAFTPDGKQLVTGSGFVRGKAGELKIWDISKGKEVGSLESQQGSVFVLTFSHDGKYLASGGGEPRKLSELLLWDFRQRKLVRKFEGLGFSPVLAIRFSPDDKQLIAANYQRPILRWELATGKQLPSLVGHNAEVQGLSYSPDGKLIASGGHDRTIKLWDAAKGAELTTLTGHNKAVTTVVFSPSGDVLASADTSGTVKLWNVQEALKGKLPKGPRFTFTKFAPKDAGFSILMPGKPQAKVRKLPSAEGEVTLNMFLCNEAGVVFQAAYSELPELALQRKTPKRLMDEAQGGILSASRGRVAKETKIKLGEHPGRDLVIDAPSVRIRVRLYFFQKRLYQIMLAGPRTVVNSQEADRFFDSFREEIDGEVIQKELEETLGRAMVLRKKQLHKEALREFQKALKIYAKLREEEPASEATILGYMAGIHFKMRNLDQAEQLYKKALDLASRSKETEAPRICAMMKIRLGQLYSKRKEMHKAEALFKVMLEAFPRDAEIASLARLGLGQLYMSQDKDEQAERLFREALDLTKGHPELAVNVPQFQVFLAQIASRAGRTEEAEKLFRAVLTPKSGQLPGMQSNRLLALFGLLEMYVQAGQAEKAVALAPQVQKVERVGTDVQALLLGLCFIELIEAQYRLGNLSEVEKFVHECPQLAEERLGTNHRQVARLLYRLGEALFRLGDGVRAEPVIRRSVEILEKTDGEGAELARPLRVQGLLYFMRGEHTKAEAALSRALRGLESAKEQSNPLLVLEMRLHILQLQSLTNKYMAPEVLEKVTREIRAFQDQTNEDLLAVAPLLISLADLYRTGGKPREAIALLQSQLEAMEKAFGSEHFAVATLLTLLAQFNSDRPDVALKYCQRALRLLDKTPGKQQMLIVLTLQEMAQLQIQNGDSTGAVQSLRRARTLASKGFGGDHPGTGAILCDLGLLHICEKDWDSGLAALDEGRRLRSIYIHRVLPALEERAQIEFLQYSEEPLLHTSLSVALHRSADPKLAELSASWLINGKNLAMTALTQRHVLARQSDNPKVRALFEKWLSIRNEIAALDVKKASESSREDRNQRLRQLWTEHAELAKQIGHEVGGVELGRAWIELDRVRKALSQDEVLIEVLRMPVRNPDLKGKPWLPERYVAWVIPAVGEGRVRIVDLGLAKPIDQAVRAFRKEMSEAERRIPAYGERASELEIRKLASALAKPILDKLLPHVRDKKHWLVSPDGELWLVPWETFPLDEKTYAVEKYSIRYLLTGRDLLVPESKLKLGPPLVVADPDFSLDSKAASQETVRLVPEFARGTPTGPVVRPNYPLLPKRWNRLLGSAEEAKTIEPLLAEYTGVTPVVRTNRQALESVVRTTVRPRIFVLSTHGFFLEPTVKPPKKAVVAPLAFDDRPSRSRRKRRVSMEDITLTHSETGESFSFADFLLFTNHPALTSGVVLAGANSLRASDTTGEDGLLTAWEIAGMDLRGTQLVVLSACETGLGRVQATLRPASVIGLRHAFLIAGARQVVGSLWRVDDTVTAELMTEFFQNLTQKKTTPEALRNAQLKMIQRHRDKNGAAHPFYWAPFTLMGQGR